MRMNVAGRRRKERAEAEVDGQCKCGLSGCVETTCQIHRTQIEVR